MERLVETVVHCSALVVPLLAIWAIACLYCSRSGCGCHATQIVFFATLLMIAGFTVRTVLVDDGCWLIHTASLGVMIVFGTMRRPGPQVVPWAGSSYS